MVSTSTFYQLNYHQQADLLLQQGTFLQTRHEDNFIIDLYELQDLLIEIFYEEDNEEPVSVMAYNTNDKLKALGKGKLKPRLTIKSSDDPLHKGNYAA
jgi:hypothetical protein